MTSLRTHLNMQILLQNAVKSLTSWESSLILLPEFSGIGVNWNCEKLKSIQQSNFQWMTGL